jgi:hypothetical protein
MREVEMAAFKTVEQEVLEKVGVAGILQSRLTNTELGVARRLQEYGNNSTIKPKLMTVHTSEGSKIIPYRKSR